MFYTVKRRQSFSNFSGYEINSTNKTYLTKLNEIISGGLREGLFSDQNYNLIWGKRCGFAKSAIAAKAVKIL